MTRAALAFLLIFGTLLASCRIRGTEVTQIEERSRTGQDFWETGIASDLDGPPFGNLREMAAASQVLVLGRVTSITVSPDRPDLHQMGSFDVEVETLEEFRTVAPGAEHYLITVPPGEAPEIGGLQQRLPSGQGVYFLRSLTEGVYVFLSPQALLIDVDGRVAAPLTRGDRGARGGGDGFPADLIGVPFDDLLGTIRALTGV